MPRIHLHLANMSYTAAIGAIIVLFVWIASLPWSP